MTPTSGGARKSKKSKKSRRSATPIANIRMQQFRIVNGRVVLNRNLHDVITTKGHHITGHIGKRKINMRKTFKNSGRSRSRSKRRTPKH